QDGQGGSVPDAGRLDSLGQTLLRPRPLRHDQHSRKALVLARRPGAGSVALIGRELGSQGARSHSAAVELKEEAIFPPAQTKQPVAVRSYAAMRTRGGVAPLDERPLALAAGPPSDRSENSVGAQRVRQMGQQRAPQSDWV